jgi:hypothetical protein
MMLIGPTVLCVLVGFIAWIIFSSIRRFQVAKLQASLQAKLLDRLDSSDALLAYVSTEAGRKIMVGLALEGERRTGPFQSILRSVQAGIVLTFFGGAFLLLHATGVLPDNGSVVMGTLPIALGLGFGIAAAATYFLSRGFGLLEDKQR